MSSSRQILALYKQMLRESSKFTGYNYRTYALKRVKHGFRDHKGETDPEIVSSLIKKAEENLAVIKRQVVISQIYREPKLVIEGTRHQDTTS